MATVKGIKNKYITQSDVTGLGGGLDGANRKQLDLVNFKFQGTNDIAVYDMQDGFVDAFEDATGVDGSSSTNDHRDTDNQTYSGAVQGNTNTTTHTTSSTWTTPSGVTEAEVLVIGGGGSAGTGVCPGGGGAGGMVYHPAYPTSGDITLTVGSGGTAASSHAPGYDGNNSVFGNLTANAGGGSGGGHYHGGRSGRPGGSGGGGQGCSGGGYGNSNQPGTPVSGATGYGNRGGNGTGSGGGGGGGGAGGTGFNHGQGPSGPLSPGGSGGTGGVGYAVSITGSPVTYAGGGGACGYSPHFTPGGVPGGPGGGGPSGSTGNPGTHGKGGGAGGSNGHGPGGVGGNGAVIIKYTPLVSGDLILVSNAQTAETAPATARVSIFQQDVTSSPTLNTDVKAYASRDNGTTYTQITLADQGDYVSGQRVLSGSADISGQPSGTSMRYKVTTHNSYDMKFHGICMTWAA